MRQRNLLQELYDRCGCRSVFIIEDIASMCSLMGVAKMTISKLNECNLHTAAVFKPAFVSPSMAYGNVRDIRPQQEQPGVLLQWIFPLLTLLGTAAAMWFVVTDGWFQLFGFWAP